MTDEYPTRSEYKVPRLARKTTFNCRNQGEQQQKFYGALGAALREARIHAGLLQGDAAWYLGCGQAFISHLETGNRSAPLVTLWALCHLYEIKLSTLMRRLEKYAPKIEGFR